MTGWLFVALAAVYIAFVVQADRPGSLAQAAWRELKTTRKMGMVFLRRTRRESKAEHEKVDEWNSKHAVGVKVDLMRDNGAMMRTTTRSRAQLLSDHTAVIWLDGEPGCYSLDRVRAVEES